MTNDDYGQNQYRSKVEESKFCLVKIWSHYQHTVAATPTMVYPISSSFSFLLDEAFGWFYANCHLTNSFLSVFSSQSSSPRWNVLNRWRILSAISIWISSVLRLQNSKKFGRFRADTILFWTLASFFTKTIFRNFFFGIPHSRCANVHREQIIF